MRPRDEVVARDENVGESSNVEGPVVGITQARKD